MSTTKRRAEKDLTLDNWDQESDPEEAGEFTKVSEDVLSKRIIRKAKRSTSSLGEDSKPSPFASFAGFVKKTPSTQPSTAIPSFPSTTTTNSNLDLNSNNKLASRSQDYFFHLQKLNEGLLSWIQKHFNQNPYCDFTPVFQDYEKYLKKLDDDFPSDSGQQQAPTPAATSSNGTASTSEINATSGASTEKSTVFPSFTPTAKVLPTLTSTTSNGHTTPLFTFQSSSTSTSAATTSTFSFGLKPSSTTAAVTPLTAEATKNFSFGISANTSAPIAPSDPEGGGDEEYSPPEPDKAFVEEDALYTKRCKLFFKDKEGKFVDRGVGNLIIKCQDEKAQLLIRADTVLGNILLNIRLSAALPMQRMGKNNVLIMCVPNPPFEDSTNPVHTLIKVKTAEEADTLLEQLNKHKN